MASKSASQVLLSSMEDVLGVEAVQYFVWSASNNVLCEFTASRGDLRQGVQELLRKIVECGSIGHMPFTGKFLSQNQAKSL
jgi:hypothetical protein